MSDTHISKNVKEVLQSKVRTATVLEEGKSGLDEKFYSIEQTKENISRIDTALLELDDMEVTDFDSLEEHTKLHENLLSMKRRAQSHLLVNMGKRKNDSTEMSDVKTNLLSLEKLLDEKANEPLTADLFNEIQLSYELTIAACRYYCDHKNPFFQAGKDRKAMVETILTNLSLEIDFLQISRNEFEKGSFSGTLGDIFKLNKKEKNNDQAENPAPEEKENNTAELSKNGKKVENILSLNIWPSELIKKAGKSQKARSTVINTYMNLHETLRQFAPGKVRCVNVKIDGKDARLLQKADNSLYIIENGHEFLMNLTAGLIADRIETDIVANDDIYGEAALLDVITGLDVKMDGSDTGENLRVRELCLNLIWNNLEISKNDFNNVPTYLVRDIAEEVALGSLSKGEIKELLKSKDSVKLINGQENLEIVRVVQKQKDDEIDSKVILKKKEEEIKQQEEPQWTKEEEQIKNLVADLLYDNETWSHDELINDPEERIRRILSKNIDILTSLVMDSYEDKDISDTKIAKMLNKLPLGEGDNSALTRQITPLILELRAVIDGQINEEAKKQLIKTFAYNPKLVVDENGDLLPDQPVYDENNNCIKMGLSAPAKALRTVIRNGAKNKFKNPDFVKELLQENLLNPGNSKLKDIESKLDKFSANISDTIQDVITEATKAIFDDEKDSCGLNKKSARKYMLSLPKEYKHLYGGAKEEIVRHKTLEALTEDKKVKSGLTYEDKDTFVFKKKKPVTLDDIIAESIKGKVGQGKFTKLVLQGYFKSVDALDKRSMIASAIRNAKPISAEDKDEETLMKEIAGNYLGGILKGAGPLLQKMMQGIPEAGLPKEIAGAIKDMKSNLLPIPDELIKAQLLGMVERSKGKITKMEVTKPLGAASVGQAFLCKMYGPTLPADGKEVVVKLLRPDVRNRLEREKKFMLDCALKTDESRGMLATYEGRLKKIMEELDLTVEANNCRMGYVYNDKTDSVQSMKINDIIEPTVNSLVLEQAEGTTVDKMFDEVRAFLAQISETYQGWSEDAKTGIKSKTSTFEFKPDKSQQFAKDRKKLVDTLNSLEKRQKHLSNLAALWVEEGIFKTGFYHGDLHAGNIMINDDHATVIDYGNAVKLTTEQKTQIIRMMGAAVTGSMESFRDAFHALLENTPPELYKAKLPELEKVFTEILNMGNQTEVGQRIMASLMRAQELGLELPSSVFNFSQGELLLQNTISDINKLIRETREVMEKINEIRVSRVAYVDVPSIMSEKVYGIVEMSDAEKHSIYKSTKVALGDVDRDELLSAVRKTKKIKADAKTGTPAVDERAEFDRKFMSDIAGIKDSMYREETVLDKRGVPLLDKGGHKVKKRKYFNANEVRQQFNELVKNHSLNKQFSNEEQKAADRKLWNDFSENFTNQALLDNKYDIFGGFLLITPLIGDIAAGKEEAFEQVMEIYENKVNMAVEVEQALKALRKEQDSWFPDADKLKQLEEDFYQKYNRIHHIRGNNHSLLQSVENALDELSESKIRDIDEELKPWFEDKREGLGDKLKQSYDEFRKYHKVVVDKHQALNKYLSDKYFHENAQSSIESMKKNLEKAKKNYENALKDYEEILNKPKPDNLTKEEQGELAKAIDLKKHSVDLFKKQIESISKNLPDMQAEWERRKDEELGECPPAVTEDEKKALIAPRKAFMETYRKLAVLRLGDVADNFAQEPVDEHALKDISDIVGDVVMKNIPAAIKMVGMRDAGRFMMA